MRIAIDLFSSLKIVDKIAVYTGGTLYVKQRIKAFKERFENDCSHHFVIIAPYSFRIPEEDTSFYDGLEMIYANTLKDIDFSSFNILFMPQVNGSTLMQIPQIKKKYKKLKIYATLHDRQHNIFCYDSYDRFYYKGLKRSLIYSCIEFYIKKFFFKLMYNYCIKYVDRVFTVSNYSLQQLYNRNINSIKYYTNNEIIEHNINVFAGSYCLFVGGGRPEKNFLRTLDAFIIFKKNVETTTTMVVTGINQKMKSLIYERYDSFFLNKYVLMYDYVSYDELSKLYANSKYVVFLSKGEGYGLPVREALSFGKAILASNLTSIPEVAGAAAYYCNPLKINEIVNAFKKFEDKKFLKAYQDFACNKYKLIKESSILDDEIFFYDFFS